MLSAKLSQLALLFITTLSTSKVLAADAEEWKKQSIYQIITDRFGLPSSLPQSTPCDVAQQAFCGGTWKGIIANLDYIQSMGFTAIWISPVHKNYDGPRTAYGDAYHGYWVTDIGQLNDRFGTAQDLKQLSDEVHRRGMLFMVDIVVNHVASLTTTPSDYSSYYFKQASQYHPYCPIDYSDLRSEQQCWMGDTKVALMDVNTEDPDVVSAYSSWIKDFVQQYKVDGLRLDAAKHVRGDFWPTFCQSAGVFCMGEVYEQDVGKAALWQTNPDQPTAAAAETGGNGDDAVGMDSILNFPLYWSLVSAFGITGQPATGSLDLTVLRTKMDEAKSGFPNSAVLGTFLENHDVPRWSGISVDPQSLYNALTFIFMSDGIPIVYYGLEQGFSGGSDPANREALWPSGYVNTTAVQMITKLNRLRNWMIKMDAQESTDRKRTYEGYMWQNNEKLYRRERSSHERPVEKGFGRAWKDEAGVERRDGFPGIPGFIDSPAQVVGVSEKVMGIVRGGVIGVVTNIGSPPQNMSFPVLTPYQRSVATTDIFSCVQYAVGSDGIVSIEYSKGGQPIILVPSVYLLGSGLCDTTERALIGTVSAAEGRNRYMPVYAGYIALFSLVIMTIFL
ncbi:glycoside hydrolase family 13 protein [Serendipita vermifera MAFF 305830]|uniref:Alpha-amylase n=1 Tax=Serendipita vermifera MAFF 305830 TaxID=933852 RepID=A0A0C3AVH6_SERVB|nr:glycoside hydrolase family 13 protein [Serendipita vermifera MAFF 305830]